MRGRFLVSLELYVMQVLINEYVTRKLNFGDQKVTNRSVCSAYGDGEYLYILYVGPSYDN